ncbi:hypothetical protein NP233_g7560 [Leucocoprinus birnbaumii]|uniref:Uncharacterized protein n=1 Tax=Leucocoprinus birnbaumii TaxID=56174 RepID=A0AAD5VNZ5_9AGAR|nr:hypothetical protein NP233_g7560 [Leucocoprinus birnbaumii]
MSSSSKASGKAKAVPSNKFVVQTSRPSGIGLPKSREPLPVLTREWLEPSYSVENITGARARLMADDWEGAGSKWSNWSRRARCTFLDAPTVTNDDMTISRPMSSYESPSQWKEWGLIDAEKGFEICTNQAFNSGWLAVHLASVPPRSTALFTMCLLVSALFTLFTLLSVVSSKIVVVNVGNSSTDNPGGVFDPPTVTANKGDVVYFNFTQGNHTVTQSVFAAPCIPAHDFNETINGFNSGFRNAGNYSAITNLQVPIEDSNTTIWYFDWNTCNVGGVGAINVNESSYETYDGFVRNAERLNGTDSGDEPTSTSVSGSSTASSTTARTTHSSSATQTLVMGTAAVVPLILSAFALML